MGFTGQLQNYLPNPSIDFIGKQQLIKLKLNQSVESLSSLVYFVSSNDEIIKALFKMALTFTNYSTSFKDNFIFFNCKYQNNYSLANNSLIIETLSSLLPFEFGLFDKITAKSSKSQLSESTLFKYCLQDKTKHIQFIENAIQDIKENPNNPKIKPLNLIIMLLKLERLDLIKMVINSTIGTLTEVDLIPINLLEYIKSTTTFDYFYQIKSDSSDRFTFEKCLKSNNGMNLMNHIKVNQKELYKQFIDSTFTNINQQQYNYSMESLLFLYENLSDFIHCYKDIEIWTRWDYFEFTLDQFIQLVNCTPANEKYSYHCGSTFDYVELYRVIQSHLPNIGADLHHLIWNEAFEQYNHKSTILQLHWVKTNRSYDLLSKRCDKNYGGNGNGTKVYSIDTEVLLSLYSYHTGKFNSNNDFRDHQNIVTNFIKSNNGGKLETYKNHQLFYKIRHLIVKHDQVDLLEMLFKTLSISSVSNDRQFFERFLMPLLVLSIRYGSIKIINYLKSNHPWIFNSYIRSDNSISDFKNGQRDHLIRNLYNSVVETSKYYNNIQMINLIKNGLFNEEYI